jgi:lysyl-tRNA synthetase class 2
VPGFAALLSAVLGVVNLVSASTPEISGRLAALNGIVPGTVSHVATAGTAITGVLLLLGAHALRRRKRRAWRAVTLLLGLSIVLHLLKGLDIEEASVAALLLAGLIWARREFYAAGDPRTSRALPVVVGSLVAADIGVGLALLRMGHGTLVGERSLGRQLRYVLEGLVGVTGSLHFADPKRADLVGDVLVGLAALTVVVTVYLVLRPAEPIASLGTDDEARLRALLEHHGGRDSLGYFALRHDKSVIWSPSGKAGICYRVVSGVMLASGDPIGDPEAWPGAITEFLSMAAEHAWVPAVMGCGEQAGTVWSRHGLAVLELGDEAVVEVSDFSLEGRAMRNVRQAVGRIERGGYRAEVRRMQDIPEPDRAVLRARARAWRGGATERGFSMALGRLGERADGDCIAVVALQKTADGEEVRGLLHFVPWGRNGGSLDLMLRDPRADNGLNEFLIVSMLRAAPGLGITRLSLNFAVFRSALAGGERLGAGPFLRAWRGILLVASRWWQIESLYRFNAKFQPEWHPRFICYPTARDIPRIAVAALEAEAFIVWPRPALRLPRRPRPRAAASTAP